jgi:HSP20 family protein
VAATPEAFYIRLDLAGVGKQDISVAVQDGVLVVRGTKQGSAPEGARIVRGERAYGPFQRTIPLPSDADDQDIAASYTQGVLELRVGRRTVKGPREIKITSA